MSSGKPPAGFPDAEAKLAQPIKQSAFERSKAEAEAKRKRDQAETAAVYEEFIKSFDHEEDAGDSDDGSASQRPRHGFGGPSGPNTGRRHFAANPSRKSGPGTLGPAPAAFGTKRSFNDFSRESRDRQPQSIAREPRGENNPISAAFDHESDHEEDIQRDAIERAELKAIAKAQIKLSNLPPGTSPAAIKALFPDNLTVDAVKIEQLAGSGTERKCTNAVITFSRDSSGGAMDAAVNSLQNRYLGYGYYLSAQRHLSSAVRNPTSGHSASLAAAQPFGAKLVEILPTHNKRGGAHGFHRGFAPPTSYDNKFNAGGRADRFYVPVTPPEDVRLLQLIHTTVERVLEYGPEFEALLMTRPEVQHDERWAWLWDPKSAGGIWYRWRLWELTTGYGVNAKKDSQVSLFEDAPPWQVPESLPFEFVSELDELVSDSDFDPSDDEESDGEEKPFLNPIHKAKCVHLLARLPTNITRLRKGDVARVTAFVLTHADRGASEVVDLIVSNIGNPYAFTNANPDLGEVTNEARQAAGTDETSEATDTSGGSLVGLYLVSDILSAAAATQLRHAWRFRGLFEKALKDMQVFEFLGMMSERHSWGRLKAEKWKRSILFVLNLWEGWSVFPGKVQADFLSTFEKALLINNVEKVPSETSVDKGKWKSLTAKTPTTDEAKPLETRDQTMGGAADEDVQGEPIVDDDVKGEPILDDDVVGEPIVDDDDVQGEPILDDDVEGEPIVDDDDDDVQGEPIPDNDVQGEPIIDDDDVEGKPIIEDEMQCEPVEPEGPQAATRKSPEQGTVEAADAADEGTKRSADAPEERSQPSRKRMRAVDMFADSDDS